MRTPHLGPRLVARARRQERRNHEQTRAEAAALEKPARLRTYHAVDRHLTSHALSPKGYRKNSRTDTREAKDCNSNFSEVCCLARMTNGKPVFLPRQDRSVNGQLSVNESCFVAMPAGALHDHRFLIFPKHSAHGVGDLAHGAIALDGGNDARHKVFAASRGLLDAADCAFPG
jgi:hypothetical protein